VIEENVVFLKYKSVISCFTLAYREIILENVMSTPGNEFRQAEYLGLGFLAVTSCELLDRLLAGQTIDQDDEYTLRRAESFLKDVSSGARLVTSGVGSNASAVETVRKLAYSVEPLKLMQDRIQAADVGNELDKMAAAIEAALSTSKVSIKKEELTNAKDFFRGLHTFLSGLIESGQRRTGIDKSFGATLMGHA
jgi:hypothetical protein